MRNNKIIEQLENEQLNESIPEFGSGDTVAVQVVVQEGGRGTNSSVRRRRNRQAQPGSKFVFHRAQDLSRCGR